MVTTRSRTSSSNNGLQSPLQPKPKPSSSKEQNPQNESHIAPPPTNDSQIVLLREQSPSSPSHVVDNDDEPYRKKAIENFKDVVVKLAMEKLGRPLTHAEMVRTEEGIARNSKLLSHMPNHPPYAAMIRRAILESNENGGSNEDSISNFIRKEYQEYESRIAPTTNESQIVLLRGRSPNSPSHGNNDDDGHEQNNNNNNDEDDNMRAMENFKNAVVKLAMEKLRRPLTPTEMARIEEGLARKSRILSHMPNHPPYAAMIRRAILELNEKGGSNENSILNFIRKEYSDLPWAHSSYLKHHLRKLCDSEEIFATSTKRYLLVDENTASPDQSFVAETMVDKPNRKLREKRGRSCKTNVNQKQQKGKIGNSGLEIVPREGQNEMTVNCKDTESENQIQGKRRQKKERYKEKIKNDAATTRSPEQKIMKIKFRFSKNEPTTETNVYELPLAVVEEEPQVLDFCAPESSDEMILIDFMKTIGGRRKQLDDQQSHNEPRPIGKSPGYKKTEAASTSAMILDVVKDNPQKTKSAGDRKVQNLRNQQQPLRRGRSRMVGSGT